MATRHLQKHFWLILCLPPCSHTHRDTQTHTQHTTPTQHHHDQTPTQNTTHHNNTQHPHHTPDNRPWSWEFFVNARISTCQATDRDLESVFVKRKVNAWICARHSTDRDLESVFNVNAWICACQTTDRDLETKKVNAWIRAKCLF